MLHGSPLFAEQRLILGVESFIMALTLFLVFLYAAGTALVLPTPLEAVLAGVKFAPGWAVIAVATMGKFTGAYAIFYLAVYLKRLPRVQNWGQPIGMPGP